MSANVFHCMRQRLCAQYRTFIKPPLKAGPHPPTAMSAKDDPSPSTFAEIMGTRAGPGSAPRHGPLTEGPVSGAPRPAEPTAISSNWRLPVRSRWLSSRFGQAPAGEFIDRHAMIAREPAGSVHHHSDPADEFRDWRALTASITAGTLRSRPAASSSDRAEPGG